MSEQRTTTQQTENKSQRHTFIELHSPQRQTVQYNATKRDRQGHTTSYMHNSKKVNKKAELSQR